MATYDASIKKALDPQQDDLIKHKEHCSADPEKLATAGRALGHQVRIKRNDDEYGFYTVSEVRQENPDNIVRIGKGGRERLGTSDEFDGTLDSQVPHATLATLRPNATANSSSGSTMMARTRGSLPSHRTAGISRRTPTSRPSASRRSWRARVSARGDARAGTPKGPLTTGTSPRPISTRRAFLFSTRSSLGASVMPSPFMGSTTPTFRSTFSSAASRARP